ncbi:TadE/TadG family type IV pilus assembly protein [Rhizobium sp. NFACC06-2]|uniref:TadE/TadG family type IV pilus assembly protein n=1 Tax=Rhizobium sp. NFACC06-2 TaxID=1566264 RepID=UPI000877427A|nr:TadE/TadG family type IV pilus assembly protein [Rhizobium sp. NFACC06-2]SCY50843.1 TadE-like protein [Rhizobium sp. NFACC06-2]
MSIHRNKGLAWFRSYALDIRAATAVEFGLLMPVYFLLVFGIFEVGLALLLTLNLATAANAGAEMLRKAVASHTAVTEAEFRQVIAANFLLGTTEKTMKITLVPIPDADFTTVPLTFPVENKFQAPDKKAGQYLLALGYNWQFILPTTRLLIPSVDGKQPQLQNISLAITAVRVTE